MQLGARHSQREGEQRKRRERWMIALRKHESAAIERKRSSREIRMYFLDGLDGGDWSSTDSTWKVYPELELDDKSNLQLTRVHTGDAARVLQRRQKTLHV